MTIISVSLNDTILHDLDTIQHEHGFSGRSEVIRTAIRLLSSEYKETEKLSGNIHSILLLIHNHDDEAIVSNIKHKFEDVTITQVHSHLQKDKCLEIFVLYGDVQRVLEMKRCFDTSRKMELVKLIIP